MKNTSRTSPCSKSGRLASSNESVIAVSPAGFSALVIRNLPVLFRLIRIRLDEFGGVEARRVADEKFDEMDRLRRFRDWIDAHDFNGRHDATLSVSEGVAQGSFRNTRAGEGPRRRRRRGRP